jgi:hypothetical protein
MLITFRSRMMARPCLLEEPRSRPATQGSYISTPSARMRLHSSACGLMQVGRMVNLRSVRRYRYIGFILQGPTWCRSTLCGVFAFLEMSRYLRSLLQLIYPKSFRSRNIFLNLQSPIHQAMAVVWFDQSYDPLNKLIGYTTSCPCLSVASKETPCCLDPAQVKDKECRPPRRPSRSQDTSHLSDPRTQNHQRCVKASRRVGDQLLWLQRLR